MDLREKFEEMARAARMARWADGCETRPPAFGMSRGTCLGWPFPKEDGACPPVGGPPGPSFRHVCNSGYEGVADAGFDAQTRVRTMSF